jgi:DNA-binding response OmpR family regulator
MNSPPPYAPVRVLIAQQRLDGAGHQIGWLRQSGHDVLTTSTGADTMARFADWRPHAVILDSEFTDMDAVSVCHEIRERSAVPILFLAQQRDISARLRAFDAGADDYLPPDIEPPELGARLFAALRRVARAAPQEWSERVLRVGPLQFDASRHEAIRGDRPLDLTPTEFAMLGILMANAGKVVTRATVLDAIWGEEATPSSNVVDRHIRTLRKKLENGTNVRRPSDYIETVSRVGYRMRADVLKAPARRSAEAERS